MSTEVIGVFDKGFAKIKDDKNRPMTVNVFIFRTVHNEAAPEDVHAFCLPCYKDTIMKNLSRLMWVKLQVKQAEEPKADAAMSREEMEMVKVEHKPKPAVAGSEAGLVSSEA